jgi:hypothetical protein
MTEQHPLTKEVCKVLASDECGSVAFSYADMCSAADWQLARVMAWLESELGCGGYLKPEGYSGYEIDVDDVIEDLKEAMRPSQQQENN